MLGLFLCVLLSVAFCDLPPAGYPSKAIGSGSVLSWPVPPGQSYENIDAVFQRVNGVIYTFKGEYVWTSRDTGFATGVGPSDLTLSRINETFVDPNREETIQRVDAVFQRANGRVYIFVDDYYYRFKDLLLFQPPIDEFVLDEGYPKKIATRWTELPSNLDAVFQLPNHHIYFFKGEQYYRVADKYWTGDISRSDRVEGCYPKNTTDEFLGVTFPIRAAFRRTSDRHIYFISDTTYTSNQDKYLQTKYEDRAMGPVPIPPLKHCVSYADISPTDDIDWNNPSSLAIFQRRTGKIYVFRSDLDKYWRLTDFNYTPHLGDCLDAGYPKAISTMWVGAPSPIRAVFQRDNGKIYMFGDQEYVRFSDIYIDEDVDPATPSSIDAGYPLPVSHFGIPDPWPAGSVVAAAFQRVNGKIYIFRRDAAGEVFYYRITDKYLTLDDQDEDTVDPEYLPDGLPLSTGWADVPEDFDTVWQRTESNQKIFFYKDSEYVWINDKYIHVPGVCTACVNDMPAQD